MSTRSPMYSCEPLIPDPKADQLLPFHLAMLLAAQLHDLRGFGFFLRELLQRFINQQQRVIVSIRGDLNVVQIEPFPSAAALPRCLPPRPSASDCFVSGTSSPFAGPL